MSELPVTWPFGRLVAFDTETTGITPDTDRIVAAAIVAVGGGEPPTESSALVNPGIDIPVEATQIHGITTERARAEGLDAAEAMEDITAALASHLQAGIPLVVFNARFDLTLLDRECRRYDLAPLADRLPNGELCPVIDPLVLDKQMDRYRRGSRKLPDACRHWQIRHDGGHDPLADAYAAARLAWRLGTAFPRLGAMEPRGLHLAQIGWAEQQARSLQAHLRRSQPTARVDSTWPVLPITPTATSPEGSR